MLLLKLTLFVALATYPNKDITMSDSKTYNTLLLSVFSSETAKHKQPQLEALLLELLNNYPKSKESDGSQVPYKMDNDVSKKWFAAYNHLILLIESRKQNIRYNLSLWVSLSAVIISIVGLLAK